ncbi:MDR family MFS transporter [Sinomonas sp. G460-2]|uniref:MDR family MFS transporter n=1 Tax=Sinomonas sp. G460-2 TaxID=3393464 RepID=UPI0039EF3961
MTSIARSIPYKWLVAIAVAMALFLEILDMTVLNTALPILGRYFSSGTSELQWVVTAYLISLAVFIPASGWVADRFGDKRTFVAALVIYTAASLWAGLVGSIPELVVARAVQGVGGGLILPVGTAMLFRAFPPEERARASALLTIPTTLAPALGPVLGGWLADEVSWRWIFFLKLPIAALAVVYSVLVLKPGERRAAGRFDLAGFLSGGGGLAFLLIGLEKGAREGWNVVALSTAALGLALGVVFVLVERRSRAPMIDLGLLRDRMFRLGNALLLPAAGVMTGALFVVPLLVQTQLGLSATQSGLVTSWQAVGMLAGLVIADRVFQRIGPRSMLMAGFALVIVSQAILAGVDSAASVPWLGAALALLGFGGALSLVPLNAATFTGISLADTGRASAIFSTARQLASAVSVALMATLLAASASTRLGSLGAAATEAERAAASFGAFHDVFWASAAIGALGLLLTLRVRDGDAAPSRRASSGDPTRTDQPQPEPTSL